MRPKNPIHPGEFLLEEFLNPAGTSQRAFAESISPADPRRRHAHC